MRRILRIGAGCTLALVLVTCTEHTLTGPHGTGVAALDFSALAPQAGGVPVPIDSLEITLQRPADESVALDSVFPFARDTAKGDSAVIKLNVVLRSNPEDFLLSVRAFGGGITWYTGSASIRIAAGAAATPVGLVIQYVGPGAKAARIAMAPTDTTVVGGVPFALHAVVFDSGQKPITGVPVGYRLSDTTKASVAYPTPYTATFTGKATVRDSIWVVAETPTHVKDSTRVHIIPPAVALRKKSGDLQTSIVGAALPAPLVVRVVDALGGGFKDDTVRWTVTAGSATLAAAFSVSDDSGNASMLVTPTLVTAVGGIVVQAAVAGLTGSPITFTETAIAGTISSVTINPRIDTIANGTTVQYAAVAKDASGGIVSTTFGWTSTVPSIATVNATTGLAAALAGDSTKIIATAGGVADTARLYVRALKSITLSPADTIITAVGDSLLLKPSVTDNFGLAVFTGLNIRYLSASPAIATVHPVTGRVKITGPGNAVIVARDSVATSDSLIRGFATLRVNQVTAGIINNPKDSVIVGVGGQTQIIATAVDSNSHPIPGKSFAWVTRVSKTSGGLVASVTSTGLVTGIAVDTTYAVDSLIEGARVFKDSTKVIVSTAPPKLLQWGFDSIAVGNGGTISVALSLTRTSAAPLIVNLTSSDTLLARPQSKTVTIGANSAGTSVVIDGLGAGRVVLVAVDPTSVYQPDSMVVTVVSTIQFQEIGSFGQQPNFYVNQNETHRAQVFLSDPAPAGGLGVTFVYGKAGTSAISPAPAIIPAGQLSADVVIQGVAPGTDSVVPTSGGFVGKFSRVNVAANNLALYAAYPYNGVLGVGQTFQPYVAIPYGMDHTLVVTATLSLGIGTAQTPDTIRNNSTIQYFTVTANSPGKTVLTVSAPGWASAVDTLTFTTPRLQAFGSTSMIAGDPNRGSWSVYTEDSLGYSHSVKDTLVVTAVSDSSAIVAVDSPTVKVVPGSASASRSYALRALPGAGGDSTWIHLTAPGYLPDSFLVRVTRPTLTLAVGYPYTGHLGIGTIYQNAGYVQIPYVRTDTLTLTLGHSRPDFVRGPATVTILPNQTLVYFNLVGDSLGVDTLSVASAGYVVSGSPIVYRVDSIHVRPFTYPGVTNYTISPPSQVTVAAYDPVDGQYRPLVKPLLVNLAPNKSGTFTFDSTQVTIDSGQYYSYNHPDTLRFIGVDTVGARILSSAPGSTADSSPLIKVFPTPLGIQLGYPYTVGRGLRLPNGYVFLTGGSAPDTLKVGIRRFDPSLDTLTRDTVIIAKGRNTSTPFEVWAIDSSRSDSIVATATGYVQAKVTVTPEASSLIQGGLPSTRLTTDPPYRPPVYTGTRSRYALNPFTPVSVTVVSTDPNVMQIDSAVSVNGRGDTAVTVVDTNRSYAYVRVRFVGSGTARLRYSTPGFAPDSTGLVSVTGPTLHLTTSTQTLGVGQLLTGQYTYVDNAVTGGPLVVQLLRSDSTLLPPNQAFTLSATSVTIPVNSTTSNAFEIQGNTIGTASLTARAAGYSQSVGTVSVGQPKLFVSPQTVSLSVGQQPYSLTVYTEDQNGTTHIVAGALAVRDSSADPAVAQADSLDLQVPARQLSTSVGIRGFVKGATQIVFRAPGYDPDTLVVSVDTGQLTLNNPPSGLGPGQVSTNQMYVSVPFAVDANTVVTLGSTNQSVLTVPASATIPKGSNYAYFTVAGTGVGTATVTATALNVRAATPVSVLISTPKLVAFLSANTNAGQNNTVTVYAEDSSGSVRLPTTPLAVTLVSSNATHTAFDSATIRIPTTTYAASTGVVFDTAGSYTITVSAPGYTPGNVSTTVTGAVVTILDNGFPVTAVTVKAGQTVLWKNGGAMQHSSISDTGVWNSGTLNPGGSYIRTFSTAGTFGYHCAIHTLELGAVIVTP